MDPNWVSKDELEGGALEYVQAKGIGPLLEGLMREVIVAKPDDPVSFLIRTLKGPLGGGFAAVHCVTLCARACVCGI